MSLLKHVNTPKDVKALSVKELNILAEELRAEILSAVKEKGGHLSANLGTVELTVALLYVFDFPEDKLLFDVGHQSYAYKMLTGRRKDFSRLREEGGISGFPNPEESEYDAFSAGHAGNAVAAGLGLCYGRDKKGAKNYVVSLVGDAALSNGLSLEALTASSEKPERFLVILNDNGMSISENENGLYRRILASTTKRPYLAFKGGLKKVFGHSAFGRFLSRTKQRLKRLMNPHFFIDDVGLKYVGTVDGHNIKKMVDVFERVKKNGAPAFIHVKTKKGKGYPAAEQNPDVYHGVGKDFSKSENAYSDAVGETANDLAALDTRFVALTAGMRSGVGLATFAELHPDRFVDVGISESYLVTLAGGMAKEGLKPYVFVYSTFLQRAYDQIVHDVALLNLPVVFCIDRAGAVGKDGATHQGLFDLSYLRHIPSLKIWAPRSVNEWKEMMRASLKETSPVAIRYPNGKEEISEPCAPFDKKWETVEDGDGDVILAVGSRAVNLAREVKKRVKNVKVVSARTVKPLDGAFLDGIASKKIATVEDNVLSGGFGSAVLEYYAEKGVAAKVKPFGFPDAFVPQATVERQFEKAGLSADAIAKYFTDGK